MVLISLKRTRTLSDWSNLNLLHGKRKKSSFLSAERTPNGTTSSPRPYVSPEENETISSRFLQERHMAVGTRLWTENFLHAWVEKLYCACPTRKIFRSAENLLESKSTTRDNLHKLKINFWKKIYNEKNLLNSLSSACDEFRIRTIPPGQFPLGQLPPRNCPLDNCPRTIPPAPELISPWIIALELALDLELALRVRVRVSPRKSHRINMRQLAGGKLSRGNYPGGNSLGELSGGQLSRGELSLNRWILLIIETL